MTTYDEFRHYEAEIRQLQVPIYSLSHGELRVVNRAQAVARYIQLMWLAKPNIVHGWLHYPNLIARIARPFCPPHYLITAVRAQYSPRALRSERITERLSDLRIVISENPYFNAKLRRQKPITLKIPNAISPEFFEEDQATNSNTSHKANFVILMVARIDPRKDHQTLLKALHILKIELSTQLKVILIGEITDTRTQQQLNNTITKYNLESIIHQLPPTNNILPYYQACDISVLPSSSEEFPNVILESFATKTPTIVSEEANRSGLVQPNINGWVFPTGDSEALARSIKAAWETKMEQRVAMGEQGRLTAAQYTIEKMVVQYEELYARTLKR